MSKDLIKLANELSNDDMCQLINIERTLKSEEED